jgi:hypothetical protein
MRKKTREEIYNELYRSYLRTCITLFSTIKKADMQDFCSRKANLHAMKNTEERFQKQRK